MWSERPKHARTIEFWRVPGDSCFPLAQRTDAVWSFGSYEKTAAKPSGLLRSLGTFVRAFGRDGGLVSHPCQKRRLVVGVTCLGLAGTQLRSWGGGLVFDHRLANICTSFGVIDAVCFTPRLRAVLVPGEGYGFNRNHVQLKRKRDRVRIVGKRSAPMLFGLAFGDALACANRLLLGLHSTVWSRLVSSSLWGPQRTRFHCSAQSVDSSACTLSGPDMHSW